jgi:hypothetical protein
MYRMTSNLKAGAEYNAGVGEVGLVANWRVLGETPGRPAIILGTSSDRIGTPDGQAYYVTFSKHVGTVGRVAFAPYAGASYSEDRSGLLYPFGLSAAFPRGWSAMLINDGVHTHLSASYSIGNASFTVLAVERKDLGFTIGVTF